MSSGAVPIQLQIVCADVAELIAPLALAQGKSITISGARDPIWTRGNAEMLHRAIRNLVENAINHTPKGTAVEIELDAAGTVNVLDRGQGIADAEREMIFQRFWRRDRRQAGGAGLGLSIVKRVVDAHGGTIAIKSRPGGGAWFSVHFVRS